MSAPVSTWGRFCPDIGPALRMLRENGETRKMSILCPFSFKRATTGETIIVPAGRVVDGASIPRALWSVVGGPFEGAYRCAAIIHDHLYAIRDRPRAEADRVFYEAMRADGVGWFRAKKMYFAVRTFGPRWEPAQ